MTERCLNKLQFPMCPGPDTRLTARPDSLPVLSPRRRLRTGSQSLQSDWPGEANGRHAFTGAVNHLCRF